MVSDIAIRPCSNHPVPFKTVALWVVRPPRPPNAQLMNRLLLISKLGTNKSSISIYRCSVAIGMGMLKFP